MAIAFSMFMLVSLSTNAQSKKVSKMMDNQKSRTEIYNSIVNNHEFMQEFIQTMNGNEHATLMMQNNMHQNSRMMTNNQNPGMMGMMHNNMNSGMMGGNKGMHGNLNKMMTQNPEMMKTCMEMMGNNMMGNNNNETEDAVIEQDNQE